MIAPSKWIVLIFTLLIAMTVMPKYAQTTGRSAQDIYLEYSIKYFIQNDETLNLVHSLEAIYIFLDAEEKKVTANYETEQKYLKELLETEPLKHKNYKNVDSCIEKLISKKSSLLKKIDQEGFEAFKKLQASQAKKSISTIQLNEPYASILSENFPMDIEQDENEGDLSSENLPEGEEWLPRNINKIKKRKRKKKAKPAPKKARPIENKTKRKRYSTRKGYAFWNEAEIRFLKDTVISPNKARINEFTSKGKQGYGMVWNFGGKIYKGTTAMARCLAELFQEKSKTHENFEKRGGHSIDKKLRQLAGFIKK